MPRALSWNSALRDLRADRQKLPAGLISARSLIVAIARIRRLPLVAGGTYDRRAIMTMAVYAAKAHQARTGAPWTEAISIALRAAWQAAKAERRARTH